MPQLNTGNLLKGPRISRISVKAATLLLIPIAAMAQVYPGGYPGQYPSQYPGQNPRYPGQYPGQYPGTGGSGIPIPGRKTSSKNTKTANQPLPNFRGTLKVFDEKAISVELGDNRVLDFKRTDKTKFFKSGDEVKSPNFNLGDQVSVEASDDGTGYMTAMNVYWEKAAGGATAKKDDGTYDTWKDQPDRAKDDPDRPVLRRADSPSSSSPSTSSPSASSSKPANSNDPDRPVLRRADSDAATPRESAAPPVRETATEAAPPPARRDPDDPGPPKLKRGGVADPTREKARQDYPDTPTQTAPTQVASAGAAPTRRSDVRDDRDEDRSLVDIDTRNIDSRNIGRPRTDDLIRRAADAALEFTEGLPSYVTTEAITRYQSETQPANFRALDVVSAEVVYENGKEDYRNITINGKKTNRSMEESGGAWSTGEFGTILINLFNPATATNFKYRRDSRVGSIMAKLYDFDVDHEHSTWSVHMGSQSYLPAYTGSIWIDPQTARVLRIEMEGKGMPENFPIDHVETVTEYAYVRLGDAQQYLLPVHSENLSCQRGTPYCSRNVIDFRNYHKYTGESNITFGGEAKTEKKQ